MPVVDAVIDWTAGLKATACTVLLVVCWYFKLECNAREPVEPIEAEEEEEHEEEDEEDEEEDDEEDDEEDEEED